MEPLLTVAANTTCEVGEAPLWHPERRLLYWVDIPRGRVFAYDPDSHSHRLVLEDDPIGAFAIQTDGTLLLFMEAGRIALWDFDRLTTLVESVSGSEDTIWNDVVADPGGGVIAGMKSGKSHEGQLYRLDRGGSLHLLLDGLKQPNGMGFSPDTRTLYVTETLAYRIHAFDYHPRTGGISNQREFARVTEDGVRPDGLTVDAEGCVWSARWGGGHVVRCAPDGREVTRISVPVAKASSLTFGGDDYTTLYITTCGGEDRAKEGELAGALFVTSPGVRGKAEYRSAVLVGRK